MLRLDLHGGLGVARHCPGRGQKHRRWLAWRLLDLVQRLWLLWRGWGLWCGLLDGSGLDDDGLACALPLHLHPDQLQLCRRQLDGYLLDLPIAVDDLLHDLDAPLLSHLLSLHRLLQLNHLRLRLNTRKRGSERREDVCILLHCRLTKTWV